MSEARKIPEVSVVVATYRRPDLLEQLLDSLKAQSIPPERFEVVVVDDGSGDRTSELLAAWQERDGMRLRFAVQENSGPATARNRGFRLAVAPLIAFTDDDCLAEPDWLEKLVEFMGAHPEVSGVGGRIRRRQEGLVSRFVDEVGRMGHQVRDGVVRILITANACYRRRALEEVAGFDERFPWPEGEDTDLSRRIIESGGLLAVADEAVIRHMHRDSARGIYRDAKLGGMDREYQIALGLQDSEPQWHVLLGMLRNHLVRAWKAPGPLIEKPAYAWLSVVKAWGLFSGMREYRARVSEQDLRLGRVNEALGGASRLKGTPPQPQSRKEGEQQ